jgi:hypothetical protein
MTKQELIKANRLTKQEIAYLDFHYGNAWFKHKDPQMYINTAREALEEHTCPICGCEVDASTWEDYRMCERCHEREYQ